MKQPSFDPVALEIMWNRLVNISEECWITLWRTAFSLIIGESQDFGCELLDARGESLAHAPRSMPVFNLTLPRAVRAMLEHFPPDSLEDGDVLVTNDPWLCAGHLFDIAMVTPVFRQGKLVGLIGSIAHCSDIGGTRDSVSAREIYEEGIQIPPMKLYRAGEPNDDLFRLLHRNVRKGDMVLGDIQAQLSANRLGAARLLSFMDEYDLDDLSELAAAVQDRAEMAMRQAIRAVEDGVYTGSVDFDGIGEPLRLPVKISVKGDSVAVDWDGAPRQLDHGGINCTMNYTAAHTVYALKCLLTPEIPSNAGCYRPITVEAPKGSILNCEYPASVSIRTMTGWYCAPAIFNALTPALPDRTQAFTGLPMAVGAYGYNKDGLFNDHLFQGGGQGAGAPGDGKSALLYPTSAANTSVELFEMRTPLLVRQKALIPDSGGPGTYRGGLGQRIQLQKLYDDDRNVMISLHPQGILTAPPGLVGGQAGRPADLVLEDTDTVTRGRAVGGLVDLQRQSQVLTIDLAGGSGYGEPSKRPLELVQRDLDEGLITPEGAARYGCHVDAKGRVQRDQSAGASAVAGGGPA